MRDMASDGQDAAAAMAPAMPPTVASRLIRSVIASAFILFGLVVWVQLAGVSDLLIPWPGVRSASLLVAVAGLIPTGILVVRRILTRWSYGALDRSSVLATGPETESAENEGRRERSLVGIVGLALFLLVMASGAVHLRHQRQQMRAATQRDLEAIANLKIAQIEGWRNERLGDARFFSQAAFVAADARSFVADPQASKVRARLLNWLNLLKGGDRYETVAYYDTLGRLRLNVPEKPTGLPEIRPEVFVPMYREGEVLMSDLEVGAVGDSLRLDIFAPVLGDAGDGSGLETEPMGYLLLRIDPEHLFFPMLRHWPVVSPTAEVMLVRREGDRVGFLCSRQAPKEGGATTKGLPLEAPSQVPARFAVVSGAGFFEGSDHRDVAVIAVTRPVPGTPWCLIVQKDQSEAYAPLRSQAWLTLGLLGLWIAATILGLRYFWERRARMADRQRLVLAERIAHLMNQANDPILLLDDRGKVLDVNRRAMLAYGYAREEFARCQWTDLGGSPLSAKSGAEGAASPPGLLEEIHRRRDGSSFPVECSLGSVRIGEKSYWQAIVRDISDRKRQEAERREFESRLGHQQKLEAIGTLASGVAHEINNPITGVMNYAQLIVDHPTDSGEVAQFASEIIRESGRVASIVRGLLQFAHREKQVAGPVRLSDIVESTLGLVRVLFRKDQIAIDVPLTTHLPLARCRAAEIQQVLMNLLTNARDALNQRFPTYHPDKRIIIDGRLVQRDGRSMVRLSVIDRGVGIPAEVRERVFEPFFTTKSLDKGTGLGLSISHGLVRDNDGVLHFETEPGKGTVFHLDLPIVDDGESGAAGRAESELPNRKP